MSSISRWPRASRQASDKRSWRSLPRMIRFRPASADSISSMASVSRVGVPWCSGVLKAWLSCGGSGDQRVQPPQLLVELPGVALEVGDPFALERYDFRGRVGDEANIGEARATAVEVGDRARAAFFEPGSTRRQVVDQPR